MNRLAPRSSGRRRLATSVRWLGAVVGLAWSVVAAAAATRTVTIEAPAAVTAGSEVDVVLTASTDAGGGEQIGFFHADYSTDSGKTWIGITYSANEGTAISHSAAITAGAPGSKILLRVRVAFRGGAAGDVDFSGGPIDWESTWSKWEQPPAKFARIAVGAR